MKADIETMISITKGKVEDAYKELQDRIDQLAKEKDADENRCFGSFENGFWTLLTFGIHCDKLHAKVAAIEADKVTVEANKNKFDETVGDLIPRLAELTGVSNDLLAEST